LSRLIEIRRNTLYIPLARYTEIFKKSFVLYALGSFPTVTSEDFCDDFIDSFICVFCFILNFI